jgi:hypothetical protein
MGPRTGLDDVERRKIMPLLGTTTPRPSSHLFSIISPEGIKNWENRLNTEPPEQNARTTRVTIGISSHACAFLWIRMLNIDEK